MKLENLKHLKKELMKLATSNVAFKQLDKVDAKTLYNAVYVVNKVQKIIEAGD